MKSILSCVFFAAITFGSISQTQLNLKINHNLGTQPFAFNDTSINNLTDEFTVRRLEYYLTVVSVTHDGGTVTPINKVLLINAGTPVLDSLTSLSITSLEKVTLAVGVDSSLNHLDPALYPASHPLAPKSPSMHWGWVSGYRFVAMEGQTLAAIPSVRYELHSLGNSLYFYTTISTAGVSTSGNLTIELNADYIEAVRNVPVSQGRLDHGELRNNITQMENFRDHVFTSVEGNPSVGIEQLDKVNSLRITAFPNPVQEGNSITISFNKFIEASELIVTDIAGKQVFKRVVTGEKIVLDNLKEGSYICQIMKEGAVMATQKLIVTN